MSKEQPDNDLMTEEKKNHFATGLALAGADPKKLGPVLDALNARAERIGDLSVDEKWERLSYVAAMVEGASGAVPVDVAWDLVHLVLEGHDRPVILGLLEGSRRLVEATQDEH